MLYVRCLKVNRTKWQSTVNMQTGFIGILFERVRSRAYRPRQNSCFQVYQAVWSGAISLTLLNFLICTYTVGGCEVWLTLSLAESLEPDRIDRWFFSRLELLAQSIHAKVLLFSHSHTSEDLTSLRMAHTASVASRSHAAMPLPQHGNHGTAVPLVTPTESHPLSEPQHWV